MASQQQLDELATDYIAGHLSEVEAEEFARLMATHPELRIKVNRLEKTVGLVLNELPLMEPPPHLRATILAQAAAPVLSPQHSSPRSLPQRSLWV